MTIGQFYETFTGAPGAPGELPHWMTVPEYSLACAVNGEVFSDPMGAFTEVKKSVILKGYPEDVRLKRLRRGLL